jgi:hypothetical protein
VAEEQAPVEGELPEGALPAEDEQQTPTVEELALKAGWTPKDEFKGDPEKWRPADEFLLVGKEKISSIGKELKGLKDQMGRMSRTSDALFQEKLSERDAYWQAKMDEAFTAGDKEAFATAARQQALTREAAPTNQPPAEVQGFAERNKDWFNKDPMATNYAIQVCELNKSLPHDKQLEIAESEVRKRFPEHFPSQQQGKPAAQVHQPASRSASRGNGRARSFGDMPKEAQDAALAFEKNHGVAKEKYAENYFKREGAAR